MPIFQLPLTRFTHWNLCCISKCRTKLQQKNEFKTIFPWFSHIYRKCLYVDSLAEYIGSSSCVQRLVWSVNKFEGHTPKLFYEHTFVVFVLWSSPNYTPIKYMSHLGKKNHITPAYVNAYEVSYIFHGKVKTQKIIVYNPNN